MNTRCYSLGDIIDTKFWVSLEIRPNCGFGYWFGPTYGGTKAGVLLQFGFGVLIAHIRDKEGA